MRQRRFIGQFRSLLSTALVLCCLGVSPAVSAQSLPTAARIKDLAASVWFGLRTDSGVSALDHSILERECNAGQFTHYPAWGGWPVRGSYNLPTLGVNADFFDGLGVPSVMHMFVGPNQYLPDWVKSGTWDQATLEQLLAELIGDTMS